MRDWRQSCRGDRYFYSSKQLDLEGNVVDKKIFIFCSKERYVAFKELMETGR